jgi:predicted DNA-binding transcriptional regulator AlpA
MDTDYGPAAPYVGSHELARFLGVSRQRISQLALQDRLPPSLKLTLGRVWKIEDILEWWGS